MKAFNTDLASQIKSLEFILRQSATILDALRRIPRLNLPHWYLGGGCISQTVWNYIAGKELSSDISDLDLAYFDLSDLSNEGESQCIDRVEELFQNSPIKIDVKNQARVHLWHEEHFGYPIPPYRSVEDAINSWPTTATCIGVKYRDNELVVYAPYGLNDMFGLIVRPNKMKITEKIYMAKVTRWKRCWPMLQIIPW